MSAWNFRSSVRMAVRGNPTTATDIGTTAPLSTATLNGPTAGTNGQTYTYTVTLNEPAQQTTRVTLTADNGATVTPNFFDIVAGQTTASFSVRRTTTGSSSIDFTTSPVLVYANRPLTLATVQPVATLSGLSAGTTGQPVTYTITLNVDPDQTYTFVPTPVAGVTFNPPTGGVSLTAGTDRDVTFTATRATDGTSSIAITQSAGLTCTIAGSPILLTTSALVIPTQTFASTLVLRSGSTTGSLPYTATVLPLRGEVPSGQTIVGLTDTTMRASILSTWDDGSAAVVVVSGDTTIGAANSEKTLAIGAGANPGGTALTTADIAAAVSSVQVDFSGTYGTATLSSFGSPDVVWWSNPRTICARYRLQAPTPGTTALEAVIDIQAFSSGRAFVEVVVENGRMNSSSPTKPTAATYSAATVRVNGSQIGGTVASTGPASAEGNHAAFRAWYRSAWVGGDPGVRATQHHRSLQRHPLFWEIERPNTVDLSVYASDTYSPWSTGRQRATVMGAVGDHDSIGPLPKWECRALQSGDYRAWQATEVSTLAGLSYNINYRDSSTNLVPTFSAVGTRAIASGTWPAQTNVPDAAMWEVAHHPALGLMAFVGRPSPVFIELAQKVAFWNGMWSSDNTPGWVPGTFGYWYQIRGRAWGLRSLAHGAFVTPSTLPWRAAAITAISNNVTFLSGWTTDAKFKLNTITDYLPSSPRDFESGAAGFQNSELEVNYLTVEVHKMARARLLTGASQTAADALANWLALGPVRFVNEQPNGGWRYIAYRTTIGNSVADAVGSTNDWLTSRNYASAPSSVSGGWMVGEGVPTTFASGWVTYTSAATAYYPAYFYAALAAAVERGVAGSETAWATLEANLTGLQTWRDGFGSDPRWGIRPRSFASDTSAWDGGYAASYRGAETFNTLLGVYNGISSSGGWAQLPGTNLQTVVPSDASLDAIAPNSVFRQGEQGNFIRIWGSAAWNNYGWFFTVPGGHFAGYRNDTYVVRLADPPGVVRMHMPSPLSAVYRRDTGILQAEGLWGGVAENNASSLTKWGPRGTHQYSGMVWDAATQKMFFGGDSQIHCLNPSQVGSSAQTQFSVYIFDPYALTPMQAWRRISISGNHPKAHATGALNNGNGTVSFRASNFGDSPSTTYTINLSSGVISSGSTYASPTTDAFKPWRHVARDPASGATYELAAQTWDADQATFALWRTSGGLTKIANLPASCWTNSIYQDEQGALVIYNGNAYVCFQTQAGTSSGDTDTSATVRLGVHQINLSTGAVQSFTTSPAMPAPDTLYAGTATNGLHGRFGYVPEVGAFAVMLSARDNVWVFRPPSSWGLSAQVTPGAYSLSFPSNVSAGDKAAPYAVIEYANPHLDGMGMWGSGNTAGVTIVRKVKTRQQAGYYAQFWYSRADGTISPGSDAYWGMHPYPDPPPSATSHIHEVAINGLDVVNSLGQDYNVAGSNKTAVSHGTTYLQGMRVTRASASSKTLRYYFNLPNVNDANCVQYTVTTANYGESAITQSPKITIGDSPWFSQYQHERFGGELDSIKIFNAVLSEADMLAESQDFSRVVTAAGRASIWWGKYGFNSVNDLTCSYGTGRTFTRNDSSNLLTTAARL